MNFNRRKNIFTLGDYNHHQTPQQQHIRAQLLRRKNIDPFERDPFKIQSYNFRYADRPTYPLPTLANSVTPEQLQATPPKPFETYFVNHDFSGARNDKENPSSSKFHEHRRRKFLLENQQPQSRPTGMSGQTTTLGGGGGGLGSFVCGGGGGRQPSPVRQQPARKYPTGADICHSAVRSFSNASSNIASRAPQRSANGITARGGVPLGRAGISTYAPDAPPPLPLLRTGCNREYMQGVRASPSRGSQQCGGGGGGCGILGGAARGATNNLNSPRRSSPAGGAGASSGASLRAGNNNSRSSVFGSGLAAGASCSGGGHTEKRHYPNVGVAGCAARSSASPVGGGRAGAGARDSSSPRANLSQYPRKSPLPSVPESTTNIATAVVERTVGTSGCQININISGLDNPQLGENLTINIETNDGSGGGGVVGVVEKSGAGRSSSPDKAASRPAAGSRLNVIETRTNNLSERVTSPNGMSSCNIEPLVSAEAYNLDRTESSKYGLGSRPAMTSIRCENKENKAAAAKASQEPPRESEAMASRKRHASRERVPSLMPWKLDERLRTCFANEGDPHIDPETGIFRPSSQMRRIRQAYSAAENDLRNLDNHRQRFNTRPPKVHERKMLNTINQTRRMECPTVPPLPMSPLSPRPPPLQRRASRNSLRSAYDVTKCYCPAALSRSASPQVHRTRSSQSPVNVNINVYTDNMKMLRV